MASQELKVWASVSVPDPVKGNTQKRDIQEEEWLQGWGRLSGVSAQQLNQILNLLSSYSPPSDICPFPYPSNLVLTDQMLHMNGQSLDLEKSPTLFEAYSGTLPDMTSENLTGFIWVVRNH